VRGIADAAHRAALTEEERELVARIAEETFAPADTIRPER
jgi:hypothetical protein